ncbi:unnamed protein product [Protopolystoma xenopodis]|uniref:Uncharacterized protein n=1 Tax=Protopolystoma xenopodis TaxID=117903 RepID=A0A3S5A9J2_9PLAT|nr:unnamed protein product [Protopolystoma xenopodis]
MERPELASPIFLFYDLGCTDTRSAKMYILSEKLPPASHTFGHEGVIEACFPPSQSSPHLVRRLCPALDGVFNAPRVFESRRLFAFTIVRPAAYSGHLGWEAFSPRDQSNVYRLPDNQAAGFT